MLQHIIENLKWRDERASHTKKLFMYPAFFGSVVMLVPFFPMIYLVPELLQFINSMGEELPLHTKALIVISDFFVNFGYVIIAVPVAAVIFVMAAIRTSPSFATQFDAFKVRLPIFGPIYRKIILARFCNYFAIMYSSGITAEVVHWLC